MNISSIVDVVNIYFHMLPSFCSLYDKSDMLEPREVLFEHPETTDV